MNDSILRVENISMCFGGVVAVDNVSFEVKKRTIHSLIGPNYQYDKRNIAGSVR